MLINLAQSYKFLDKNDQCLSTLSTIDWSACSDNFALCVAVLKDDFEEAARVMKRVGPEGAVKRHEYIDWPVFKEFRKSAEFASTYTEVFGTAPSLLLAHEAAEDDEERENQERQPGADESER